MKHPANLRELSKLTTVHANPDFSKTVFFLKIKCKPGISRGWRKRQWNCFHLSLEKWTLLSVEERMKPILRQAPNQGNAIIQIRAWDVSIHFIWSHHQTQKTIVATQLKWTDSWKWFYCFSLTLPCPLNTPNTETAIWRSPECQKTMLS